MSKFILWITLQNPGQLDEACKSSINHRVIAKKLGCRLAVNQEALTLLSNVRTVPSQPNQVILSNNLSGYV